MERLVIIQMDLWTAMKGRSLSNLFHRQNRLIRLLMIPLSSQPLVGMICASQKMRAVSADFCHSCSEMKSQWKQEEKVMLPSVATLSVRKASTGSKGRHHHLLCVTVMDVVGARFVEGTKVRIWFHCFMSQVQTSLILVCYSGTSISGEAGWV